MLKSPEFKTLKTFIIPAGSFLNKKNGPFELSFISMAMMGKKPNSIKKRATTDSKQHPISFFDLIASVSSGSRLNEITGRSFQIIYLTSGGNKRY